jgi:hypothetical protein
MIQTVALPSPEYVARLLGGLLDKEVAVGKRELAAPTPQAPALIGVYVTDDGEVACLCILELGLAAFAGAALSLIPARSAQESIKAGQLSEAIADNSYEILNVGARLFNSPRTPHVTLRSAYRAPGMLPSEVTRVMSGPVGRLDLEVEIPDYGAGKMWLLTT